MSDFPVHIHIDPEINSMTMLDGEAIWSISIDKLRGTTGEPS